MDGFVRRIKKVANVLYVKNIGGNHTKTAVDVIAVDLRKVLKTQCLDHIDLEKNVPLMEQGGCITKHQDNRR